MGKHIRRRRWGVRVRRPTNVLVVLALLVPALILAGPARAGNVAVAVDGGPNLNAWHRTTLSDEGVGQIVPGFGVTCSFTSRYAGNGSGIQMAEGGECDGSIDTSPTSAEPGEPGSKFRAYFIGAHRGAARPQEFSVDQPQAPMLCRLDTSAPGYFGGATTGMIMGNCGPVFREFILSVSASAYCWNGVNPSTRVQAAGVIKNGEVPGLPDDEWNGAFAFSQSWTCQQQPTAKYIYEYTVKERVCHVDDRSPCRTSTWPPGTTHTLIPGGPVGSPEGTGAGDPCQAEYDEILTDHPRDGATAWGTIPGGGALFGHFSQKGPCDVGRICMSVIAGGKDWDDHWAPGNTMTEPGQCQDVDWPLAEVSDPTSTEPEPDPDADAPVTEEPDNCDFSLTDPSTYVCAVTDVLKDMFAGLVGILKKIFGVLGDVLDAILDLADTLLEGIKDLFVPDPDTWNTSDLIQQMKTRPPMSVVVGVAELGEGVVSGFGSSGDCPMFANFSGAGLNGAKVSCASMTSVPGHAALYGIVQFALVLLTGLGVMMMFGRTLERGQ